MAQTKQFRTLTAIVCSVFDVEQDRVFMHDRHEDVVNARCVICHLLRKYNISTTQIAKWLHMSIRHVNELILRYYSYIENSDGLLEQARSASDLVRKAAEDASRKPGGVA